MGKCGNVSTLCWKCANACGGCSWTERDKKTGKVRFQPVEGWKAVAENLKNNGGSGPKVIKSFRVIFCPMFRRDERRTKE